MARVIGTSQASSQSQTIYDPTRGSGSLLLKAADETPSGVTIYGQEMDNATAALAKMNMILHDNPTAEIWQDNTLSSPHFKDRDRSLKTFDFVVANPPFSNKAWSNGFDPYNDEYNRFQDGVPPKKNGDYAFLLHLIRSLKSNGKGAIILPHGVLFRGNVEGNIRKNIIRRGYIKGIIGLPSNLFYGTGIPACIIILDKENAPGRTGIFIIDASKGFMKDGNKNRLRHQDIRKIVDVFNRQLEIPKYSRIVPFSEISDTKNDYNLNIPRYIDSTEPEDLQDIEAHLLGGIPNRDIDDLARYWDLFPTLRECLFAPVTRSGYSDLRVAASDIKTAIFEHPEYIAYTQQIYRIFEKWKAENIARLRGIAVSTRPKQLIAELSEDLLLSFSGVRLIDRYDVYQHLMTYWTDTMQDDVYILANDGWVANPDLIPPHFIIARYFAAEQQAIEKLEAERGSVDSQMEEIVEQHSGEDSLLEEVINDRGKITKKAVKDRFQTIEDDPDFIDEYQVLSSYLALMDHESYMRKQIRGAQKALNTKVDAMYIALSEDEVKTLVVDDKWLKILVAGVRGEVDRISQSLGGRIKELEERYAQPLPELELEVGALTSKVENHLMQQLLNGKSRLPGFRGEWDVKKIGDILNYEQPGRYISKISELNSNGPTPVLTANKSFILGYTDEMDGIYDNYPVIIFDDFTTASKYVDFPFKVRSSAIKLLTIKDPTSNLRFIYEKMQLIRFPLGNHKRYYISEYQHLEIQIPSPEEQNAISQVICDMDAEIATLKRRHDKICLLKQGMMQELLT